METPSISLRRHPIFALLLLVAGFAAAGVGLWTGEFWILFMGVLPIIFAALLMLSPFVVITDKTVELKNLFGIVGVSYDHDGFHLLRIQNDVLYIQKGDMQAAVRRIVRSRLHQGDWKVMEETIATAKKLKARK